MANICLCQHFARNYLQTLLLGYFLYIEGPQVVIKKAVHTVVSRVHLSFLCIKLVIVIDIVNIWPKTLFVFANIGS